MRLLDFGTFAAVAVTALALGQPSKGLNNKAPAKGRILVPGGRLRNGPGVPLKRGSKKVGFRGWKKFSGKNAKPSKKGRRKPIIPNGMALQKI